MKNELYLVKNKIPELSYAMTIHGIELAVLDITHPHFISSIDETKLKDILSKVEKTADKNAEKFNKIPGFIKRFFAARSFIMSELLKESDDDEYLTGISTLMLKLGPNLIGKGKKRFFDRLSSRGIGGIVLRMRVRDISKIQAEALIPLLSESLHRNLCFINIAGGAASDSINTLFLIQQMNPALLRNRKIEINVLDIDRFGPAFADRCVTALKAPGGRFSNMDVSFNHIQYDWNNTQKLKELLSERKEWLQICSSEGGLFEYASDEVIIQHLSTIHEYSASDASIAGSLMHDIETIDRGAIAALKISTSIKPRFLGIDGLKSIIKRNKWRLGSVIEGNPRYLIFKLDKCY